MQLSEYLPYDMREVMRSLPADGEIRNMFRRFSLNPHVEGRARSVKAFAEDLGFVVVECELPRGMNGRLVPDTWAETRFRIEVNKSLSVEAKRFAVLHEIGHFFRHTAQDDPLAATKHFDLSTDAFYPDELEEREANEFAEALLFGSGQLAAAHGLHGGNIAKLSRYFGVTEAVIRIAIEKLKRRGGAAR